VGIRYVLDGVIRCITVIIRRDLNGVVTSVVALIQSHISPFLGGHFCVNKVGVVREMILVTQKPLADVNKMRVKLCVLASMNAVCVCVCVCVCV
jgi:hypothetical protein